MRARSTKVNERFGETEPSKAAGTGSVDNPVVAPAQSGALDRLQTFDRILV